MSLTGRLGANYAPRDYEPSRVQELYQDALSAWRRNPIAWRIVAITTDYVVGDSLTLSSPNRGLNRFIDGFWNHPKNRISLRLESMCDELSRSGDLFVLLFRNPADGMSYVRFVTKDQVGAIETAANDWETELSYTELPAGGGEAKVWLSPEHPRAAEADAVMLHYSVNRPVGALMGESDLTTMIPWLQRYTRMLEDRVRLNWAVRSFLWLVTVPGTKIMEKREQYRNPPEAGSIIVKDEGERWEAVTPALHASDASKDLQAVRMMIDSGSGYPPHWRGEGSDVNLATATAMQSPTERHLLRRQQYFVYVLEDIVYHAYRRAVELGMARGLKTADYGQLFMVQAPDISRSDNESLARAARDIAGAMETLARAVGVKLGASRTYNRIALREIFRFGGAPQSEEVLERILEEAATEGTSLGREEHSAEGEEGNGGKGNGEHVAEGGTEHSAEGGKGGQRAPEHSAGGG